MRLARGSPISLGLEFKTTAPAIPTGRVALAERRAQIEWSPEVVAAGYIVPGLYYPPEPGLHAARTLTFDGLHGFLADALPEGWGRLVMHRRLAKLGVDMNTLSPLDQLALVGSTGRGALTFDPVTTPEAEVGALDLDALAQEATLLLDGEEGELTNVLAKLAGGSGGARPKVNVGYDSVGRVAVGHDAIAPGLTAWIVKFRAKQDPSDIGPIEAAYACMAAAAGIEMSAHRLIPAKSGPPYFATRRFDRPEPGKRLHMISLAGAIEADPALPSSYDLLLRATRAITRQADDVASAFRRMVFNVLAHNRDDHLRQHAFLMDDVGQWRLSPAYDLTYSPGPSGEHYLDVEGEGRNPNRAHVTALGANHGLSIKQIDAVIEEVRSAVSDWSKHALNAGVGKQSTTDISKALARVAGNF